MTRSRALAALIVLLPILWIFGGAVVRGDRFNCRDTASFYYPLFAWECEEWESGRMPLWSAHDNLGLPLLADGSSSVLYPAKLVFALPLSFPQRFALYIVLHVLGAAAAAWWLARRLGASCNAAGLCAVSYVLGGSVLFQYSNPIFLVGSAWLPLAMGAAERTYTRLSYRWACALGAILAMMVLGGDPQLAYHVMLLCVLLAWLRRRHRPHTVGDTSMPSRILQRVLGSRLSLLATSAVVGYALAAVQIMPAAQSAARSERAAWHTPRNVWEAAACVGEVWLGRRQELPREGLWSGILNTPKAGTHYAHIYEFSVGPWRWAEWFWPNFSGRSFPTNRRWISMIPSEGRAWTPSLYLGLLPIGLAISALRWRHGPRRVRWISWCVLLAIASSLGWFGIGWLVHQVRVSWLGAPADTAMLGQPVGGPYWLMVTFLPGYAFFRYPAKWLVIASLGLSLLSARGFDRVAQGHRRAALRVLTAITAISLAAVAIAFLSQPMWQDGLHLAPANKIFGPLDTNGALRDLEGGLLHATLIGLAAIAWIALLGSRPFRGVAAIGVVLAALDLSIANSWMVTTQPSESHGSPFSVASDITGVSSEEPPPRILRVSRWQWFPHQWNIRSSDDRLSEILAWEEATLAPRHQMPAGVAIVESFNTLVSQDMLALLKVMRERSGQDSHALSSLLDALSVRYLVGPTRSKTPRRPAADSDSAQITSLQGEPIEVRENPDAFPRCWIVHDVLRMPPLGTRDPLAVERRTREVLFPEGVSRDFAKTAIVETARPLESFRGKGERDACRIARWTPTQVEIEAELKVAGLLVWNDHFDPGWVAEAVSGPLSSRGRLTVLRTNRLMRGVQLPAGKHRIVWSYRPRSIAMGAFVSIASAISLCVGIGLLHRERGLVTLWLRRRR